jgi:hypothetical protein
LGGQGTSYTTFPVAENKASAEARKANADLFNSLLRAGKTVDGNYECEYEFALGMGKTRKRVKRTFCVGELGHSDVLEFLKNFNFSARGGMKPRSVEDHKAYLQSGANEFNHEIERWVFLSPLLSGKGNPPAWTSEGGNSFLVHTRAKGLNGFNMITTPADVALANAIAQKGVKQITYDDGTSYGSNVGRLLKPKTAVFLFYPVIPTTESTDKYWASGKTVANDKINICFNLFFPRSGGAQSGRQTSVIYLTSER